MTQAAEQKLDKGTINEGLKSKLMQTILVTSEQLQTLAHQRADGIIQNLVYKHKVNPDKLIKAEPKTSDAVRDKWVGCAIEISY